ncbi:MAG: DUF4085 family protein [Caldibacillus sp.]
MWNLTKEAWEKFLIGHSLVIPETDEEWSEIINEAKEEGENLLERLREELEEIKDDLLRFIPDRFIPYIEDGTINQPSLPKTIREDILKWQEQLNREFEQVLEAAAQNTQNAVRFLPEDVQEVFSESMHDAVLDRVERSQDSLHLYFDTEDGFSTKAYIHLIFQGITPMNSNPPIEKGQILLYHELIKTDSGFVFRALVNSPDVEWTLEAKNIAAKYFFRPKKYVLLRDEDRLSEVSFIEYLQFLDHDQEYWLITPDLLIKIRTISSTGDEIQLVNGTVKIDDHKLSVFFDHQRFDYYTDKWNPIQFIYTNVYENPYQESFEDIPFEQLEDAVFNGDRQLQLRAWNTMYSHAHELAGQINEILRKIEVTEEQETLLAYLISYFYEENILDQDNIKKFSEFVKEQ